jgi:hypothetical protein
MPLTMRGTIVSFVAEQLQVLPVQQRGHISALLTGLFDDSLRPRHDSRYADYSPQPGPEVPARFAAYSANLALLLIFSSGQVKGTDLFPAASDPVHDWRKLALLWRSQLPPEGWTGLIESIVLDRTWDGDRRNIILRAPETAEPPTWHIDLLWNLNVGPNNYQRVTRGIDWSMWTHQSIGWLRNQARFTCDAGDDFLAHALEPVANDLGPMVTTLHSYWPDPDRATSAANALITMWLTSGADSTPDELATAYDTCLQIAVHGFEPLEKLTRERFRWLVLRQLAADQHRLPKSWLEEAKLKILETRNDDRHQGAELLQIANETIPDLMATN